MHRTLFFLLAFAISCAADEPAFRLSTFSADVTVPAGHGMMGGAWLSKSVADPLLARGFILAGDGFAPVIFVSVDWCEIRNEALARWKTALAAAAGTTAERVMVCAVHQHEAPVADLEAERILREHKASATICDPEFHEQAVQRVAAAAKESLAKARRVTHFGTGQGQVAQVASNRRFTTPGGTVSFSRMSSSKSAVERAAEEGLIDPWLKTLSFWDGETPVAALSVYAVHPMSYYRTGEVSADFPGLARAKRQEEMPAVFQIYASGCSGNIAAGKYNDGTRANRPVLAERLHAGLRAAWEATARKPITGAVFRHVPVRLEPRDGPGWTAADLAQKVADSPKPFDQCLAALGLSWRRRADAGARIDLPALDFGGAVLVVLPGEAYVEYQLYAQQQRPGSFVIATGYGDGATGYIPTEQHIREGDSNLADWCWIAPGAEPRLQEAIRKALGLE
jgi:hypothetical protein